MVLKLANGINTIAQFENDVKTYGTETLMLSGIVINEFENDVKTYGTETVFNIVPHSNSLRMM